MGIYRGTAPLKAYRGDMQPVNVYRGSTKVAGWHSASYSGTSPLTVDCDYNVPPDALTITGRCVQTGTPSPDSPAPISAITGNVTITGANGAASDTVTVAMGSAVCASLPDGTHDSYDAVTGVLTKRVGKGLLDGGSDVYWYMSAPSFATDYAYFYTGSFDTFIVDPVAGMSVHGMSDLFVQSTYQLVSSSKPDKECMSIAMQEQSGICTPINQLRVFILKSRISTVSVNGFKTWLASNPVTIYYKLAKPTTVQLTPHLPVVRTGIKTLSVGADVVPTLSATVKSMD